MFEVGIASGPICVSELRIQLPEICIAFSSLLREYQHYTAQQALKRSSPFGKAMKESVPTIWRLLEVYRLELAVMVREIECSQP